MRALLLGGADVTDRYQGLMLAGLAVTLLIASAL